MPKLLLRCNGILAASTPYLAVRQSHICAKCKGGYGRHSKLFQRIGCDEQGFEKARLQVRRDDDLLRFYARLGWSMTMSLIAAGTRSWRLCSRGGELCRVLT